MHVQTVAHMDMEIHLLAVIWVQPQGDVSGLWLFSAVQHGSGEITLLLETKAVPQRWTENNISASTKATANPVHNALLKIKLPNGFYSSVIEEHSAFLQWNIANSNK